MEDDADLLARFLATRDPALREALILRYVPLVHFVVNRLGLSDELAPNHEDYVSQGLLGLIEAVDRYDPKHGAQFSTYATLRVRGRIIDEMRSADFLSRGARRQVRAVRGHTQLWGQLRRDPTEDELATHLQMEVTQLRTALVNATLSMISLDTTSTGDEDSPLHECLPDNENAENADPDATHIAAEALANLEAAVRALPAREQHVLALYYVEQLTLKEIGQHSRAGVLTARAHGENLRTG
jgi:RNA polymerase sigma factor for flagellar operon FliA